MSENPLITFDSDKLGLKPFSEKLEKFLMVDRDFVEGSLVVSLNGTFGSGKTTFLSMWKNDLDQRRQIDSGIPMAITLNAWESDYCGDPLLSVITGLIEAVDGNGSEPSPDGDRLREAAKDVAWFATGLANNMVSHWTGVDPVAAAELAKDKKEGRQPAIPDFISLYEERTKALKKLKKALRAAFGGDAPLAIIFVDELDRCRPDYAISYLETIKHVFDINGLIFVLAVDYEQLGCSARALFGRDLNFAEYFRKFVQRTLSLPEPDEVGLRNLASHYSSEYFEKKDKRFSLMDVEQGVSNLTELITALKMTPRQIQATFRIIGHSLAGEEGRRVKWCVGVGVVLMSVLKVMRPLLYDSLGKDKHTHLDVGQFLIALLGNEKARWWFSIYFSGGGSPLAPEEFQKLVIDMGFSEDDLGPIEHGIKESAPGWGYNRGRFFQDIHGMIESATTF